MSDRDVTCAPDDYTAKLMSELVQVMEERDTLRSKFEVSQGMRHDEHERHVNESAQLRERITTQKQTIQVYRDESREWREAAERAQAENAKLRELAADMLRAMRRMEESAGMDALVGHSAWFAPKLHELGIEVDA